MRRIRRHPLATFALFTALAGVGIWLVRGRLQSIFHDWHDQKGVLATVNSRVNGRPVDYAIFDALGPERSVRALLAVYQTYRPSHPARWVDSLETWWWESARGKSQTLDNWVMGAALNRQERSTEEVRGAIAFLLKYFGPAASPAVPVLVRRLEPNPDPATIETLGAIGPAAAPALPHLCRLAATCTNLWFLDIIAANLRRIEPGSQAAALPGAILGLNSTDERTRAKAAQILGLIGPPASNTVPRLRELRGDPWKMVRDAVEGALESISPTDPLTKP